MRVNTYIYSNYAINRFSPDWGFPQAVEGTATRTFGGSLVANNPFAQGKSAPVRTGQTGRILSHRRFILVLQNKIEEILLINVLRAIWLSTGNVDLTGLLAYSPAEPGNLEENTAGEDFSKIGRLRCLRYGTVPYHPIRRIMTRTPMPPWLQTILLTDSGVRDQQPHSKI